MGHTKQSVDIERARAVEELVDGKATHGGVEELDHVEGGQLGGAAAAKAVHELQQAARVGADDGFGACGEQVRDLAIAKFVGGLGMEEVIDAGGAAAERGFSDLFDDEVGDLCEELAWLLPDALCVTKMTGVVVGDAKCD